MIGTKNIRLILLFCSFLFSQTSFGKVEIAESSTLTSTTLGDFNAGKYVEVFDGKYYDLVFGGGFNGFYNKNLDGLIRFSIDPSNLKDQLTSFSNLNCTLRVVYDYFDPNSPTNVSTSPPQDIILSLDYNPDGVIKAEALHYIPGAYRIKAEILNSVNNLPNLKVNLKAEITTERYYEFTRGYFNSGNFGVFPNTSSNFVLDATNNLQIEWDNIAGAEEYDLEWVHVNSHAASGTTLLSSSNVELTKETFRRNATRVSTENNFYSIPLLFDQGYLAFRVRAKGKIAADGYNKFYESNWSSDPQAFNFMSDYDPNAIFLITNGLAFEANKNWNYELSFSEGGNKKYNLSYADGSSRVRQSVISQNNTLESTVVETIYDYQGRPVINSIPTPTGNAELQFYSIFNASASGVPYGKNDFDLDSAGSCANLTQPFFTATAGPSSGKYYSPSNTNTTLSENMYVPDAGGYPFTQVFYTPDKTGRVRAKTMPGLDFKEGSGKESSYIYATPYQKELDLLFGSDVGYAHKYKKNVTINSNGQSSITYVDPNDKTIATVLTGPTPNSLVELEKPLDFGQTYSVDLLSKMRESDNVGMLEKLDYSKGTRELSRVIPVTNKSIQQYTYINNGERYKNECIDDQGTDQGLCYDCVFDVEVSLKDNCDIEYLAGIDGTSSTMKSIGNDIIPDGDCDPTAAKPSHSKVWVTNNGDGVTQLALLPGSYNLKKILTINEVKLQLYTDHFIANNVDCLKDYEVFKATEKLKLQESINCNWDCSSCKDELGINYGVSDFNPTVNSNCDPCITQEQYDQLYYECDQNCESNESQECEIAYRILLSDMSPGGQYGLIAEGGVVTADNQISDMIAEVNPNKFLLSIYNDFNHLPRRELEAEGTTNKTVELPSWRLPIKVNLVGQKVVANPVRYLEEDGTDSKVFLFLNSGAYSPEIMSTNDIQYENGDPFVYPHQLKYVKDFLNIWQSQWAEQLVPYHPEYGYYQYCVAIQASNNFDQKIRDANDLDELRVMDSRLHDAFRDSYSNSSFFTGVDPFFYAAGGNPYEDDILALTAAMQQRLVNYTIQHSAWQMAYALGNADCEILTCPTCVIPNNGDKKLTLTNDSWHYFRSLYLSIKEQIKARHRHYKVITNTHPSVYIFPSYNECIGTSNFNKHENGFFRQMLVFRTTGSLFWKTKFSTWENDYSSQYFNFAQACNKTTYRLFANKERRFDNGASHTGVNTLVDEVCRQLSLTDYTPDNCAERTDRIIADLKKKNDVQRYLQCGQCPISFDLQSLLNGIIRSEDYNLTDESFKIECNIGELTNTLGSLFQSDGLEETLPPDPSLSWENTGSTTELNIDIGQCNLVFPDITGFTTYDQVTDICCIQAGSFPGEFTFTIFYQDAVSGEDKELQLTGVASCLDFANCDFGDKCEVTDLGYQFQDLLNNLTTLKTCTTQTPCATRDLVQTNHIDLQSAVHQSAIQEDLNDFLANKTNNATSFNWRMTSNVNDARFLAEINNTGSSGCGISLEAVDGTTQVPDWSSINYFFDIQVDERTGISNQFFIKASDDNGVVYQLIGNSCFPIRSCTPYLEEPLFNSHISNSGTRKLEKNRVCEETFVFYQVKDQLEVLSGSGLSFLSGNQSVYSSINITGASQTCSATITLINSPYDDKALQDIIDIQNCFVKISEQSTNRMFATVEFSDNTLGTVQIDVTCGDVFRCEDKTVTSFNFNCNSSSLTASIKSNIGSFLEANKSSLVLIASGSSSIPGTYSLSALVQSPCELYLHQGIKYNTTGNSFSTSFVDASQIVRVKRVYVDKNPNSNGEVRFAYVVCEITGGELVDFKLELVGSDCFFSKCSDCYKPNLISNGDFSSAQTVTDLLNNINTASFPYQSYVQPSGVDAFSIVTYGNYFEQIEGFPGIGPFDYSSSCIPSNLGLHSSISEQSVEDMTGNFLLVSTVPNGRTGIANTVWQQNVNVVQGVEYEFSMDAFHWIPAYLMCTPQFDVIIDGDRFTFRNTKNLEVASAKKLKYPASCPGGNTLLHDKGDGFPLEWTKIKVPFTAGSNSVDISIQIIDSYLDPDYAWLPLQTAFCTDVLLLGLDNLTLREKCVPPPSELCKPTRYPDVDLQVFIPSCDSLIESTATYSANVLYERYIDSVRQNFREEYIKKCLNTYEELNLDHTEGEHHATLYYYDQSGNLVRTIPPKGVIKIPLTDLDDVREDRALGRKTVFSEHEMATTYSYNSLGQLIKQKIPDNDDLNLFKTEFYSGANLGLPQDFHIRDIKFTDTRHAIAVGYKGDLIADDEGLIYVTNDAGRTWQKANSTGIYDYLFISPEKHIVGERGQLLVFDNTVSKWIKRTTPTRENLVSLQTTYNQGEIIIYSENGNRWMSDNFGLTWGNKNSHLAGILNGKITDFSFDLVGSKGLAVSDLGNIYFSTDFGATWNERSSIRAEEIKSIAEVNNNLVFCGVNGSIIEHNSGSLIDLNSGLITNVGKVVTLDATNWVAHTIDGSGQELLKVSANGGLSWSAGTSFSGNSIQDFFFKNSSTGYLVDGSNVYNSTNGGGLWSTNTDFPTANYQSIFSEGNLIYAGLSNSIQYIQIGNTTQNTVSISVGSGDIKEFTLDHGNGKGVILRGSEILLSNTGVAGSWTWSKLAGNYASDVFVDIHFINLLEGVALTDQGKIIETIDGGITWTLKSDLAQSTMPFKTVYFSSLNGKGSTAGDDGEIWVTTDGGMIWNNLSRNIQLTKLASISNDISGNTFYVSGENGTILKTDDNASNWRLIPSKTAQNINAIDVVSGNGLFGGDQVVGSLTSGVVNAITSVAYSVKDIDYNSSANSYLLHSSGLSTGQYGSFTNQTVLDNSGIAFLKDGSNLISVGENGKIHQKVGTASWINANEFSPPALKAVFSLDANKWLAGGSDGYLAISLDGGGSWEEFSEQPLTTTATINGIYFSDENLGMIIQSDGRAYKYNATANPKWSYLQNTSGNISDGASCPINDLAMLTSSEGVLLGKCNIYNSSSGINGVWKTVPFTNTTSSGELRSVVMVDYNRGYAAGENGRFVEISRNPSGDLEATDKGHIISGSSASIYEIHFTDRVRGYAINNNELFITIDGGDSWNFKTYLGGQSQVALNSIVFTDLGVGYYAGEEGSFGSIKDFTEYFSDRLYYDRLGRGVASQNAKQFAQGEALNKHIYTYTLYDAQGRIHETGELVSSSVNGPIENNLQNGLLDQTMLENWISNGAKSQITRSYYDNPMDCSFGFLQDHLRSRVSSATYEEVDDNDPCTFDHGTHYSYDNNGNIKTLIQDFSNLADLGQRFKTIEYEYDLISGNIQKLHYQDGANDQFHHKYTYDGDNRIEKVYTSTNGLTWTEEVEYEYYKHGPLKRVEFGEWDVQGMDFAYTIQGRLKAINSNTMKPSRDIGRDGIASALNKSDVAVDAIGINYGYYRGDYHSIGSGGGSFEADITGSYLDVDPINGIKDLYDGNISYMTTAFTDNATDGTGPQAMIYRYDQLTRLKSAVAYTNVDIASNTWGTANPDGRYATSYTYDPNGNIKNLTRNDGDGQSMDNFEYKYQYSHELPSPDDLDGKERNRLLAVIDNETASATNDDLKDGQSFSNTTLDANNYVYDELGGLIEDKQEKIDLITRDYTGKTKTVERFSDPDVGLPDFEFHYDVKGNRVRKIIKPRDEATGSLLNEDKWLETIYVRDAMGMLLATYTKSYSPDGSAYLEHLVQDELYLFGTEKLGSYRRNEEVAKKGFTTTLTSGLFGAKAYTSTNYTFDQQDRLNQFKGYRHYELKNHLNNVLAVINDIKKPKYSSNINNSVVFTENFEEDRAWSANNEAEIENDGSQMRVTLNEPENGIIRDFSPDIFSGTSCTYTYCFTMAEPVPEEGLYVETYSNGNLVDRVLVVEGENCLTISSSITQIAIMMNEIIGNNFFIIESAGMTKSCTTSVFSYYEPLLQSRQDYYPFGMLMPGSRGFSLGAAHKYGFNGMERDDLMKGNGNSYDFGARLYDTRIGRWQRTDPLEMKYPSHSPYAFAANNPIIFVDPDGNEIIPSEIFASYGLELPPLVAGIVDGAFEGSYLGMLATAADFATDKEFRDAMISSVKKMIADPIGALETIVKEFGGDAKAIVAVINGTATKEEAYRAGKAGGSFLVSGGGTKLLAVMKKMGKPQGKLLKGVKLSDDFIDGPSSVNGRKTRTPTPNNKYLDHSKTTKNTDGTTTYYDKKGNAVTYSKSGHPDFSPYTEVQVELKNLTGNSSIDARKANMAVGLESTPSGYNWHHAADGKTMQLVPEEINKSFSHTGGAAIIREQK